MLKNNIEKFAASTMRTYGLLELSDTPPGFLKSLHNLMISFENDPASKYIFNQLKEKLINENMELQRHKQSLVDWMSEKLHQMQQLKISEITDVKIALKHLKIVLSGRYWQVRTGGFLETLVEYFYAACRIIAKYGPQESFEDWLKISVKKQTYVFDNLNLRNPRQSKEIQHSSKEEKQLFKRLGHGYVKATILPRKDFSTKKGDTRIDFEWGLVDEIVYPEAYHKWLRAGDMFKQTVDLDCNELENLRQLLLLRRFVDLQPVHPDSLPEPKTILECDEFCNQQRLQYHLSEFNVRKWEEAPLPLEEIMKMVSRLLTFFVTAKPEKAKRGPRKNKESLRDSARKAIHKKWNMMIEKKIPMRIHDDFTPTLFEIRKESPNSNFDMNATTDTLIGEVVKAFAKEKGFIAKRGKDRNPGKRLIN